MYPVPIISLFSAEFFKCVVFIFYRNTWNDAKKDTMEAKYEKLRSFAIVIGIVTHNWK